MKNTAFSFVLAVFFLILSCAQKPNYTLTIENSLDIPRAFETVEIHKSDLKLKEGESFVNFAVRDIKTKTVLVSQFVDEDLDGEVDVLLFQPEIGAKSTKEFELVFSEEVTKPEVIEYCYSRFVPERTDDYAWENNKVGFRTYGPNAQYRFENDLKEGTLSSGIDAWLKRVDYSIINSWYKKYTEKTGTYHEDTGEGLDNFHVGSSRGVGGIAVKLDTTFYISKNFINWKTITTGPIRTSFILDYGDWEANGKVISEKKHITLDYGSNLSKFEIEVSGVNSIYSGLTLHENDGETTQNKEAGWISYWQPHDNSELGTAIIVPNNNMLSSELYITTLKDRSNLYAEVEVENGKATFYSGFGWKEAGEFTKKETWERYLNDFTLKINTPLTITFN
ncbi:MAG: DUF4861 family protein [Flavobacteriaceae bacterium]